MSGGNSRGTAMPISVAHRCVENIKTHVGVGEVHFDQGALGYKTVKPTPIWTGLDELLT